MPAPYSSDLFALELRAPLSLPLAAVAGVLCSEDSKRAPALMQLSIGLWLLVFLLIGMHCA